MRNQSIISAIVVSALVASLYACGGGGGDGASGSATVSAYVTDDLGNYDSVEFTLHTVQLRHTTGRNCEIIHGPLTIDFAELGHDDLVDHVDTTICEAGPYNRLHVALNDDVTLRRTVNNQPVTNQCKFVSYYDSNSSRPNRLACSNGTCSLDITGAINLVAGNHEHVALDADLKEFTVDYSTTPCEVTLKVSPLRASDKLAQNYRMRLSGTVSNLNATEDRFHLTVDGSPYLVLYAGITDQTGLDTLLQRAASDRLRTRVRCDTINYSTTPPTCTTSTDATRPLKAINVKAEGSISALNTSLRTFALNHGTGTPLPVNYYSASAEGALSDGVSVEVKLYGFNLDYFLAREVEVENGN